MSCECNNANLGCNNPCNVTDVNTAACESLPSQIENFTLQFFGEVIKTEVDGKVTWSLPCNLDVGLTNNPRGVDEGLACYFLRLFEDGITGRTGPQGPAGANGTNGNNAYTVTLASFAQPSLGNPNVTVITAANPAILAGLYVFIATSGWYVVNATDGAGTLFLSLVRELSGAPAIITAGKLVVPSGFPGASVTGPQGPQGPQGPAGPAGATPTVTNVEYFATLGTDFNLPVVYTAVTFVNSSPNVLLTDAGKYLIAAVIGIDGLTGVATTDIASFKLRNTSAGADVPGSEVERSNIAVDELGQMVINRLVTTSGTNQTIALFGKCTTADRVAARALFTTISAVRIQ